MGRVFLTEHAPLHFVRKDFKKMLKLSAGCSQKVPGQQDFSSQGFSCSIDIELPDSMVTELQTLRGKIDGLFQEAKAGVDRQIQAARQSGNGNGQNGHNCLGWIWMRNGMF